MNQQRIIQLTSENVKRVQIAQITPEGNVIVIGGDNGQGKSSLIDSIEMAIGGGDSIPEKPIRDGATKARIVLETEDLIIQRTFSKSGTQLVVTNKADGAKIASPQELLNSLTNRVAFDPLGFLQMKADKQAETLRQLVGIDFTELDKEHAEKYAKRTETNRDVKKQEAKVNAITRTPGLPAKEKETAEILKRLEEAQEVNKAHEEKRGKLLDYADKIEESGDRAAEILREIEALKIKLQAEKDATLALIKDRDALKLEVEQLQDIPLDPIRAEIATIDADNAKIRENLKHAEENAELVRLTKESNALTDRLKKIDEEKEQMLSKAKFPIEGLSFAEGGITYDGIPFDQVNTANQLRVSVAIAFAMKPTLKIALVRNGGNDLDRRNLALLSEYVAEHNGQLWLEKIADGPEVSVIMEDGLIKEDRTQNRRQVRTPDNTKLQQAE